MSATALDPRTTERRLLPRMGTSRALFNQLVFSGKKGGSRLRVRLLPATLILHVVVLAAVVLVPLFAAEELPKPTTSGGIRAFFVEPEAAPPPPPPPPAPPKAAAAPKPTKVQAPVPTKAPEFVAPMETPPDIPEAPVAGAEGLDTADIGGVEGGVEGGVPGGVEGGVVGGVEGGTPGGIPEAVATPEPAPEPTPPPGPVRVGGQIKEPRKLKNVAPQYPDIAKQARVQGVVVLEATIDTSGRVQNVRVLRGIPLLNEAAMDAVRRWVYSPTLLNGQPVPLIMTVTVNFTLGG
jgi:periplasmic protein TonB